MVLVPRVAVWAALGMLIGCAGRPAASGVQFNENALAPILSGSGTGLADRQHNQTAPNFDDPREVLVFVLQASPSRAIVYPTERYYYYKFPLGGRVVSGNIRFADVEDGECSVGYFDFFARAETRVGRFRDGEDGVSLDYDEPTGEVRLALDGVSRTFVLDRRALRPPGFDLLPGERAVSGVRDESGYALQLLYYQPGRCFYYVLDERMPVPERLIRGEGADLETWFGEDSRFCFVRHPPTGRLVLVGVHRREIEQNTWYDGPFDQVPPRLPLREMLEEAYPYVLDAGGLDEHGNFLEVEGQRVAISPYRVYESGPQLERDLAGMVTDAPDPTAWTTATYESKRDWRPPSENPSAGAHQRAQSLGWPANHWQASSRWWGTDHQPVLSRQWPVNHDVDTSSAADRAD